ncbi:MAG: hypothetical protein SCH71_10190 [Desulfobulbaceae bacterium]|nr:hypothetical protein [Desulfobulbaceae bacterium]
MAADKAPGIPETPESVISITPGNMVSAYAVFTSAVEQTMLIVPAEKHFVLTDIIGMASIEIKEGDVTKVKTQLGYSPDKVTLYPNLIRFRTGIVFSPGTNVVVYPYPIGIGLDSSYGYVTLSGYYF